MRQPGEVDESEIIDNLRQSSDEFKEFCDIERSRAGHIKWCYTPGVRKRLAADAAHAANSHGKCHKICLARFPVSVDDAHLVAHEMMHAIFAEENNKLIIYERKNPNPRLSPYLGSMLEDPIIERLLFKNYKFNLSKDYLRWISIMEEEYDHWREPIAPLYQIAEAFNLANKMMCWKWIEDGEMLQRWNDFLIWYGNPNRCPNILSISQELVAITEKFGLITLGQRSNVFLEIIKKYKLEKNVSLQNIFDADPDLGSDICPPS